MCGKQQSHDPQSGFSPHRGQSIGEANHLPGIGFLFGLMSRASFFRAREEVSAASRTQGVCFVVSVYLKISRSFPKMPFFFGLSGLSAACASPDAGGSSLAPAGSLLAVARVALRTGGEV